MKKKKIILIICTLIVLLLLAICAVKYYQYTILNKIITNIANVREEGDFYYEVNSSDEALNIKMWAKDNKVKVNTTYSTYYVDIADNKTYFIDEANKAYQLKNEALMKQIGFMNFPITLSYLEYDNSISFLKTFCSIKELSTENIDSVECFKIKYENKENQISEIIWIDKESLLPVRSQDEDTTSNYTIKVHTATSEEVTFNNKENYQLLEH